MPNNFTFNKMNLVLDFGNTRIKAASFENGQLKQFFQFNSSADLLQSDFISQNFEAGIIGSVTTAHEEVFKALNSNFFLHLFSAESKLPLKNTYESARTLGSDRMAVAVGAFSLYPNQAVLSIDAGTCIKYNFVNAQNEYLGGAISPGLPMRLNAMHHYTAALPQYTVDVNYTKLIGNSTKNSMLSGALIGAACEVDGMIERYRLLHPNLIVAITGGDSEYLCKQLKNRFFAHQYLLLQGLHTILNYNRQPLN